MLAALSLVSWNILPAISDSLLPWQVFAQRRPVLHKVLDWEDELFALITAFLDRQSLASSSSTFADSLYGLRRAPYTREGPSKSLKQQQQKVTLLLLVRRSSQAIFRLFMKHLYSPCVLSQLICTLFCLVGETTSVPVDNAGISAPARC